MPKLLSCSLYWNPVGCAWKLKSKCFLSLMDPLSHWKFTCTLGQPHTGRRRRRVPVTSSLPSAVFLICFASLLLSWPQITEHLISFYSFFFSIMQKYTAISLCLSRLSTLSIPQAAWPTSLLTYTVSIFKKSSICNLYTEKHLFLLLNHALAPFLPCIYSGMPSDFVHRSCAYLFKRSSSLLTCPSLPPSIPPLFFLPLPTPPLPFSFCFSLSFSPSFSPSLFFSHSSILFSLCCTTPQSPNKWLSSRGTEIPLAQSIYYAAPECLNSEIFELSLFAVHRVHLHFSLLIY